MAFPPAPRAIPAPPDPAVWISAEFQANALTCRYRVRGRGPLVIALSRKRENDLPRWCESLARTCRVVVPELAEQSALPSSIILGLAEVFGGGEALVLADSSARGDALALATCQGLLVSLLVEP